MSLLLLFVGRPIATPHGSVTQTLGDLTLAAEGTLEPVALPPAAASRVVFYVPPRVEMKGQWVAPAARLTGTLDVRIPPVQMTAQLAAPVAVVSGRFDVIDHDEDELLALALLGESPP